MANLIKPIEKAITLTPNVVLVKYLRALLRTGLYGSNYAQAVEELLRQRIAQLIDADKLKLQDEELTSDADAD